MRLCFCFCQQSKRGNVIPKLYEEVDNIIQNIFGCLDLFNGYCLFDGGDKNEAG